MTLLDFYADWCQPCKMMEPIIEKFKEENPNIIVEKVNTEEQIDLAVSYNINVLPTFVLLDDNNEEVKRHLGVLNPVKLKEFVYA